MLNLSEKEKYHLAIFVYLLILYFMQMTELEMSSPENKYMQMIMIINMLLLITFLHFCV